MKKKWLFVVLISALMAVGLVLASCGNKCPGDGNSEGEGNCKTEVVDGARILRACSNANGCGVIKASAEEEDKSCGC